MSVELVSMAEAQRLRKAWRRWQVQVKQTDVKMGNNDLFTDGDYLRLRLAETVVYLYQQLEKART